MSLSFLVPRKRKLLGIDIGTAAIKIVELERGKTNRLANYVYFHNKNKDDSFYFNSFQVDTSYIVNVIRAMLDKSSIVTTEAFMSIPVAFSFSTIFSLPIIKKEEMNSAINFEARKFIPVPMDEVYVNWNAIDFMSSKQGVKILMIAVPKETINKYNAIARALRLQLRGLEIESFSLVRSLVDQDEKECAAVIDIGEYITNICITEQDVVSVHHTSNVSGRALTNRIASMLSVSVDRANTLKNEQGLNQYHQLHELLAPLINKMINEVVKSNDSHTINGGTTMQKVILSGGSSHIPGLQEYLNRTLNIPVVRGDEFGRVTFPDVLEKTIHKQPVDFSVALGLAMK